MTPLPKRRHSTRRGGKREAAIKKTMVGLEKCPKCGTLKKSHRVCPNCGYYSNTLTYLPKVKSPDKK